MSDPTRIKRNVLLTLSVTIIGIGTVFYRLVEGFSWVDSFYFTIMTLTTVGYGDLYPVTKIGKLFTAFYVIVGLGVLLAFVSFISERVIERRINKKERNI